MTRAAAAVTGQRLLRRLRQIAWCAALAGIVLLIPAVGRPEGGPYKHLDPTMAAVGIIVLSAFTAYRGIAEYVRAEGRRAAVLTEDGRREGVALATRTIRHHVGNKLAVAAGLSELLADDPRLPSDLEGQATRIMTSALAAAEAVQQLDEKLVRVRVDSSVAGPPLLDLNGSTATDATPPAAESSV